jgi:hypothetical protein
MRPLNSRGMQRRGSVFYPLPYRDVFPFPLLEFPLEGSDARDRHTRTHQGLPDL